MRLFNNFYFALIMYLVTGCNNDPEMDANAIKSIQSLDSSSIWLIENGVKTYYEVGKRGINDLLIDRWAVQIWTDPWMENTRYINGFWIKRGGIHYQVINLFRTKINNSIYEFWFVKLNLSEWSDVSLKTNFYIARADGLTGTREILISSDQFIKDYELEDGELLSFPATNLEILYELEAWNYPDNYLYSDLDELELALDAYGNVKKLE